MVTALLIALQAPLYGLASSKATLPPIDEYDSLRPESLTAGHLYATSAILIDGDTGRVLFEKDADRKRSPASTTKIMTLMLGLEALGDRLDDYITIPDEAGAVPKDSSVVPVKPGEKMTARDLLYGFMMMSGNDGANAVAVLSAGSLEAFIDRMNERAAQLGMTNTHFANAHGYTDEEHYSSARDLATLTREAMKDETFRRIVGTGSYTMEATARRGGLTVENTNLFGTGKTRYRYQFGTGVKTGNTDDAGYCLVGSATDDRGVNLISVVLNATATNSEARWIDTTRLMNYGFARYRQYSFLDMYGMAPLSVKIDKAAPDDPGQGLLTLTAVLNRSSNYYALSIDEDIRSLVIGVMSSVKLEYDVPLEAPIEQGTVMGTLTYDPPGGGEAVTAVLIADRSIERAPDSVSLYNMGLLLSSVPRWMIGWVIALLLILIVITWSQAASRRRRRRAQKARRRR
ncbi:MAG: D-alanyl-D-alanine carboxypeptidase [Clostridiales bacterium]|nr:D-alanyl-D-alanine carboxypeptidase [Clostridiales bacterium]